MSEFNRLLETLDEYGCQILYGDVPVVNEEELCDSIRYCDCCDRLFYIKLNETTYVLTMLKSSKNDTPFDDLLTIGNNDLVLLNVKMNVSEDKIPAIGAVSIKIYESCEESSLTFPLSEEEYEPLFKKLLAQMKSS